MGGKNPPPFAIEGMLYYSTLVKLELIRQVLSLKCNNVKEIQTEYHSPYKTRQKKKKNKSSFVHVSFFSRVHVQCFWMFLSYIGAEGFCCPYVVRVHPFCRWCTEDVV